MTNAATTEDLAAAAIVPVCTPQVWLEPRSPGIVLARFSLGLRQTASMSYLHLDFVGYRTLGYMSKVNTGMPAVYVGLYASPAETPFWLMGDDIPGQIAPREGLPCQLSVPGEYAIKLVNNHASSAISAIVTGVIHIHNA